MNIRKLFISMTRISLYILLFISADFVVVLGAMNLYNLVIFAQENTTLDASQIEFAGNELAVSILFILLMFIWYGFRMIREVGEFLERKLKVGKHEKTDIHQVQK